MSIHKSTTAANRLTHAADLTVGEIAAFEARSKLARLMPFHRWCAALDPTEAAKEMYLYVRARLKMRAAESSGAVSTTARVRVKRPRASKSRNAAPMKDGSAEQQLG